MALTFPSGPADGATFTVGSITWTYSATSDSWTGATGGTITTQFDFQAGATAPTTTTKADGTTPVTEGDHFWDATNDKLYVYSGAGVWAPIGAGASQFDWQTAAGVPVVTLKADNTTPLTEGDLYWDATANELYSWNAVGSVWVVIGSKWATETGGISRADRIKVGSVGAPLSEVEIDGTTIQNVVPTTGTMDITAGQVFSCTVSAATTFAFSAPLGSPRSITAVLHLTNGGAAAVSWNTAIKWPSATSPALTALGLDVLVFHTVDGGATWRGNIFGKDVK